MRDKRIVRKYPLVTVEKNKMEKKEEEGEKD